MNKIYRTGLLAIILFAALTLTGCTGIPYDVPGLVMGQTYRLESGDTLNEDLTVVGGNATIEEDATVNGDVAVIGGNVTVDGTISGNLSVMGGYVNLDDHAVIEGQVQTLGGTVQHSELAVVEGKDLGDSNFPGPITAVRTPNMTIGFEPITKMLMAIFQALALAALALVINLVMPMPMERTGQSAMTQAPASGGVGCLTILVLLVATITIILIPVSLLGFLVAGVAILFGWASLGLVLGRRLAAWLKQTWTDPISAGAGTLTLSLLTSLIGAIPCIGWTVPFAIAMVALGAVVLTRFGTQIYPAAVMPPYPPANYPPAARPDGEIYPATQAPMAPQEDPGRTNTDRTSQL